MDGFDAFKHASSHSSGSLGSRKRTHSLRGSTSTSRPEKWDVRPSDAARPPGSNLKIWGEVEYAKER